MVSLEEMFRPVGIRVPVCSDSHQAALQRCPLAGEIVAFVCGGCGSGGGKEGRFRKEGGAELVLRAK